MRQDLSSLCACLRGRSPLLAPRFHTFIAVSLFSSSSNLFLLQLPPLQDLRVGPALLLQSGSRAHPTSGDLGPLGSLGLVCCWAATLLPVAEAMLWEWENHERCFGMREPTASVFRGKLQRTCRHFWGSQVGKEIFPRGQAATLGSHLQPLLIWRAEVAFFPGNPHPKSRVLGTGGAQFYPSGHILKAL